MKDSSKRAYLKKIAISCSIFLFVLYTAFMIYVLFISSYYNRIPGRIDMNLIPFRTITNYIKYFKHYGLEMWLTNLFGNIIVFIPLGVLLPVIFKNLRGFVKVVSITLLSSLLAEILQRIFEVGSFDVDDIILNTIGGALGYLIYKIIIHFWKIGTGNKK